MIVSLYAGDAQQVENAEVWDDLIKVVGDTSTLKHFFKDYCKTDVVDSPLAEMYQDSMSIPLQDRQGKLLVCRDSAGHAEPAVKCAPSLHGILTDVASIRTTLIKLTVG